MAWRKIVLLSSLIIYICLVLFSLFNYKSHCVYTPSESLIPYHLLKSRKICEINFKNLNVRKVNIFTEPNEDTIAARNPYVKTGGQWAPESCVSYQKVAVIIPYRNRLHHLRILLNRLHPLLHKQQIDYRIFLVEQAGNDKFNRGKLMNVGFMEALKYDKYDCFVFHDADLIPEHDRNIYMCDDHVRQLSSAIDETRYHVMFYNYAGGVAAMKKETMVKINGYPNSYWGWGNEDDDMSARAQAAGLLLTRPPEHIGRFKMIRHTKASRSDNGYTAFLGWRGRWMNDGLNAPSTMNYTVLSTTNMQLYTNVTVDLGPSKGHVIDPEKDTTKESIWWFLSFYFP